MIPAGKRSFLLTLILILCLILILILLRIRLVGAGLIPVALVLPQGIPWLLLHKWQTPLRGQVPYSIKIDAVVSR